MWMKGGSKWMFGEVYRPLGTVVNIVEIMCSSENSSDNLFIGLLRRFLVNTALVWPMLGLYLLINHHQPAPTIVVLMPTWVPFAPSFMPVYLGLMLITWLLPVMIFDRTRFRASLRANLCAWLLVMPWWILTPTVMSRPPIPEGSWGETYQWLWAMDHPYNVMPCAHGVGPVVAAWFVGRERPSWRWPLAALLLATLPSISLVWQHRPVDILLGTVAAGVGIAVAEWFYRRDIMLHRSMNPVPA
ncbi:MAG: superfamily protein [Verrucomicrobiales bacterium]|nr:superfamily protein [Verrucomicrobiales bacterium]